MGFFQRTTARLGHRHLRLGGLSSATITFSGPAGVNPSSDTWFNTDQTVSWTVADNAGGYPPTGVAGFSQSWDTPFSDPTSEPNQGTGNSFYSGPEFPNATSGYLLLSWAGQGCHYADVDAWDNTGITSFNNYFYWICYDTVSPNSSASLSGSIVGSVYSSPVNVTISSSDPSPGSGVSATYYQLDGG